MIEPQFIMEEGKPKFAVIKYEEYLKLIDKLKALETFKSDNSKETNNFSEDVNDELFYH